MSANTELYIPYEVGDWVRARTVDELIVFVEFIQRRIARLAPPAPSEDLYCIMNRYAGDNLVFWREEGKGYTTNLDEAWKVSKEKAAQICSDRPEQDIPLRVADLQPFIQRHVTSGAAFGARRKQGS